MTTSRRIALTAGAVIVAFLIGFIWQYMRAERLETALGETRHTLALTQTEATLGAAVIEAERGKYEESRQLASDFFNGLQQSTMLAPQTARPVVAQLLSQRDSVITLLSRSEPQGAILLSRMFADFRTAVHGPGPMTPKPAAPAAGDSGEG
jgi:hypothetical protein